MKDVHDLIVGGGTPAIDPAVEFILHAEEFMRWRVTPYPRPSRNAGSESCLG